MVLELIRLQEDAHAEVLAAGLRCAPYPAFLVDAGVRLVGSNLAAEQMLGRAFAQDLAGRLCIGHPFADHVLQARVHATLHGSRAGSAALRLGDGRVRGLHFTRLDDGLHVLLTVRLRHDERGCDVAVLAETYGLTPAEIRLLSLLLAGQPPKAAAASLKLSLNTIRAQIRSILIKSDSGNLQLLLAKTVQII